MESHSGTSLTPLCPLGEEAVSAFMIAGTAESRLRTQCRYSTKVSESAPQSRFVAGQRRGTHMFHRPAPL
jgi:hypothetical protein